MKTVSKKDIKRLKDKGIEVKPTRETELKRLEDRRIGNTNKIAKDIVSAIRSVGVNLVDVLGEKGDEVVGLMKADPPEVVDAKKKWNFMVKRDGKGFIKSIEVREL